MAAVTVPRHNARMNRPVPCRPPRSPPCRPAIAREPVWRVASRLQRREVPESALRWLLDPASLTRRLTAACGGRFRGRGAGAGLGAAAVQRGACARVARRGACAAARGVPAVRRRAVGLCAHRYPARDPRRPPSPSRLPRNRGRSGAVLFADPGMRRGPVEVAGLSPCDRLYPAATRRLPAPPPRCGGGVRGSRSTAIRCW
ncbi:MAG: hypothetical protein MZV65_13365 [Chromatiales bacterium]|nr:hypothetical protein [Chromatiales bacterium]